MQRKRCKILETCEESSYFNLAASADYFTLRNMNDVVIRLQLGDIRYYKN